MKMSFKSGSPGVRHKNTKSSQQVNIYETKVEDVVVAVCSKPTDVPEASFTFYHQTKLFEGTEGVDTLAAQTGIIAALHCRAKGGMLFASIWGGNATKPKPLVLLCCRGHSHFQLLELRICKLGQCRAVEGPGIIRPLTLQTSGLGSSVQHS